MKNSKQSKASSGSNQIHKQQMTNDNDNIEIIMIAKWNEIKPNHEISIIAKAYLLAEFKKKHTNKKEKQNKSHFLSKMWRSTIIIIRMKTIKTNLAMS